MSRRSRHVEVKLWREGCGSWACSECAKTLGRQLRQRLEPRLSDERVIMVTLTLDRSRWESPRAAYDELKRTRAVACAVASFCAFLGIEHRGSWISKMELQSGGWPHWHVLLVVPEELELPKKGAFDDFWEWGFSNVRHQKKGNAVRYFCKYVSKPADSALEERDRLADSGLPAKGVRWITAARGFWGGSRPEPNPSAIDDDQEEGEDSGESAMDEDAGKGLEERVAVCDSQVTVYVLSEEGDHKICRVEASYAGMLQMLLLCEFWFSPGDVFGGVWRGTRADVRVLFELLGEAA